MNEKPTENVINDLPIITKFIYSIGVLPTSYKMSMTYEEQVVWLCNYLETTIIPAVNQNGEAVEELQNLYELLRTYVNDYFDNLDVQEEINNKLNEMASSGQLINLIKNYVDPIYESYEDNINRRVDYIDNKVDNIASGSPLVASSTAGMTDRTRVYVNTTDGKWYYFDGTEWVAGGTYQATSEAPEFKADFAELKKDVNDISENLGNINLLDETKILLGKGVNTDGELVDEVAWWISDFIEMEEDSVYLATLKSTSNAWGRGVCNNIYVAYYDKYKNFISRTSLFNIVIGNPNVLIESIEGASYFKLQRYIVGETSETLVAKQYMVFKTTDSTASVDERIAYQPYLRYKRVGFNNLAPSLQTIISNISDISIFNIFKMKNKYRYLALTFSGSARNGLILLGTNDLKRFDLVAERGIYTITNGSSLRDPAIIQIGEYYYITYTIIEFSTGNEIGFCRTKDFITFEELNPLEVLDSTDETIEFNQVWAPAWFRDIDGKIYIISACREENQSFYMYINEYNPDTHSLSSGHKTNISSIDGHIYYENGKYYMAVGGAHIWKSDTLLGTWTGITNNNLNVAGYEADYIMKLDSGKWRIYVQELIATFGTAHMKYADADSLDGVWTDLQPVEYTEEALDYVHSINNNDNRIEYYHWTIFDFNNLNNNNNNFIS